jgi:hypothetical protein
VRALIVWSENVHCTEGRGPGYVWVIWVFGLRRRRCLSEFVIHSEDVGCGKITGGRPDIDVLMVN